MPDPLAALEELQHGIDTLRAEAHDIVAANDPAQFTRLADIAETLHALDGASDYELTICRAAAAAVA